MRALADDRGSGAVLALTVVAVVVVVGLTAVTLSAALAARQHAIGAADLAALAAADAASGLVAGSPCEIAARVADAGSAQVDACDVDGLVVRVTVASTFAGIPIQARSAAGPPP